MLTYMQIIENILGHRDRKKETERKTRIKIRTYTRTISHNNYSPPVIEPFRETEREIRIKRRTYTPTMSDGITTVVKAFTQNERETNMNHGTYLSAQTYRTLR